MEENKLFGYSTAWLFPVVLYTTDTSYVEVKKASGIAYILLQLISSSTNGSENISVTLNGLGVPKDIHYIFADELASLCSYGIVQMRNGNGFYADSFDIYQMSDFEVTELGQKLFAEGTIPTGNNKQKKISVYYDTSTKDTYTRYDGKLYRWDTSALDESCVGNVLLNDSDVENFINNNIGKLGFRKGERISGYSHCEPEYLVCKKDDAAEIVITKSKALINIKDKERNNFVREFYSLEVITRIIDAKKKFHFANDIAGYAYEYDFGSIGDITKICMPSEMDRAFKVKSQLSINKDYTIPSECVISENDSKYIMDTCDITGVACYFENNSLYSIVPGRFWIEVEGYTEKCAINLIVTQQISDDVKQQVLREIFLKCLSTDKPMQQCLIIKKLSEISNQKDYVEQFTNALLKNKVEYHEKIDLFLELDSEFEKVAGWESFASEKALELFEILCEKIELDHFSMQETLAKKLNKIIGLPNTEYLSKIIANLIRTVGEITAFEALEDVNYSTDVILGVINVFDIYCDYILNEERVGGSSKLGNQCALLGRALIELKDITGIDDPYEDPANVEFDKEQFIKVMATFIDQMKNIETYKSFATDKYSVLEAFKERFVEIKEVVAIEKAALHNPKSINKSYIEQKLKKSSYKDAICDLHVRLQYELNRLMQTDEDSTYDLLLRNDINDYLTDEEVSAMHMLRTCRNGFQHPEKRRNIRYSENTIREWCAIVEKLGGMTNESRS